MNIRNGAKSTPLASVKHQIALRVGYGTSIAQHGELFQGQVEDSSQRPRRCLVSLPCKKMSSRVVVQPRPCTPLNVYPAHKLKASSAVEFTFAYLGVADLGGTITVESNIPEAKGYGSSTADCVAAAIAAADAVSCRLTEEEIGNLVVKAEIASDSIMFNRAVLFAHREGAVLENYARAFPRLEVLGIDTTQDSLVDTLDFTPADYSRSQMQAFAVLEKQLRQAIQYGDLAGLGYVATASACINELYLPKPGFEQIRKLVKASGALGIAVAHSGTILSILLDPKDHLLEHKVEKLTHGLEKLGISNVLRFNT